MKHFRLAHTWRIRATPGAKMLSDSYQVAPRSFWALRSRGARELLAYCAEHPTFGAIWRNRFAWQGPPEVRTDRPSMIVTKLRQFDRDKRRYVPILQRESFSFPDPTRRAYVFRSVVGDVFVDAEWADIWTEHGCAPSVASPLAPVRWCDSNGNRVGYTMPIRPPRG